MAHSLTAESARLIRLATRMIRLATRIRAALPEGVTLKSVDPFMRGKHPMLGVCVLGRDGLEYCTTEYLGGVADGR